MYRFLYKNYAINTLDHHGHFGPDILSFTQRAACRTTGIAEALFFQAIFIQQINKSRHGSSPQLQFALVDSLKNI